jgi:hypothetical protein
MRRVRPNLLSTEGIEGLSLVAKPAIQEDFIAFSEEGSDKTVTHFLSSDEKMQIVGPSLIPDLDIPRKTAEGVGYMLVFTAEDIEALLAIGAKRSYKTSMTLGHQTYTDGAFILETWIKESQNDKSTDYGFGELPVGTMFNKVQVTDQVLWNEIKEGGFNGFSIEMFSQLKEIEMEQTEITEERTELTLEDVLAKMTSKIDELNTRIDSISATEATPEVENTEEAVEEVELEEAAVETIDESTEENVEEVSLEEESTEETAVEETTDESTEESIELEEQELLEEQNGKPDESIELAEEAELVSAREASRLFKERWGL